MKTFKNSLFMGIVIFILHVMIINPLEYKKNKNIKFSEKTNNLNRLQEIKDVATIKDLINKVNFNSLIIFCVTWSNQCQDYIKILEAVSSYKLTNGFGFYKVDCTKHKQDICDHYHVSAFPTLNLYLNGNLSPHVPVNPDVESILEFVDKINSSPILKLSSHKEILNIDKNYGDSSFMFVTKENMFDEEHSDTKNLNLNEMYECYEKIAMDVDYKPLYYFSEISESLFKKKRNYEIKIPAIVVLF